MRKVAGAFVVVWVLSAVWPSLPPIVSVQGSDALQMAGHGGGELLSQTG